VLDGNIDYHSHTCLLYKTIFTETPSEIVEKIKEKIDGMEG
jgi:hypothetical protein